MATATVSKKAPTKGANKRKVTTLVITGRPEKPYRAASARAEYWERFVQFNGKSLSDLEESCMQDPPSKPKKGRLRDKVEPFGGWLSFFKEQGLVTVKDV